MPTDHIGEMTLAEKRALLAQLLSKREEPTQPAEGDRRLLSYGQQAMWFINQLAPTSAAYNVAFCASIRSEVSVGALERALQRLLDRHPMLRTVFAEEAGRPVQHIQDRVRVAFQEIDTAGCDDAEVRRQVEAAYSQPFDLEAGPLLRCTLFGRGPSDSVLLLVAHHIVLDAWSMGIFVDELRTFYAAEATCATASLPGLAAEYVDFVDWQRRTLEGAEGQRLEAFWREQLHGPLPVLDLPTDRPRPSVQTFEGDVYEFWLEPSLVVALKQLARTERTTLHSLLLSAFVVLLHRWSGQDDLLVGMPTAGRDRPEFAPVIGNFVDMQVMRADCSGNPSFREALARVRQTALQAIAHQGYPLLALVKQLRLPHDPSRSPLYQVAFDLQRAVRAEDLGRLFVPGNPNLVDVGGLAMQAFQLSQQAGLLDLMLQLLELDDQIAGNIKFNTDLFDATTIARFADQYRTLLHAIVENADQPISRLNLLSADAQQVLEDWNATGVDVPLDVGVHQLVEAQARRTPTATAIESGRERLSYFELNRRGNQLAHELCARGIGHGAVVAIHLERSADLVPAVLGVLKSGAAYLPLDPTFPPDRLAYMLEDAGAAAVVTQRSLVDHLPHTAHHVLLVEDLPRTGDSPEVVSASASGEDLAYVIYTSGSTGRPKGVEIPHRAVVNFLHSMREQPGLSRTDVLLAVTTLSFDISVLELLLPLTVGARVHVAPSRVALDGSRLARLLSSSGATVMQATPVTWRLLLEAGWQSPDGFKALCGGEALPRELARDLLARGAQVWNLYGPTETTVWSTAARIESAEGTLSVGRPIANTEAFVVDAHGQPTPVGVAGELWIAGRGLARGYLGRPELTANKFVPHPTREGERAYRTGDRARFMLDGRIEVLGRMDQQVKLRGYRIEPGEIEAVLAEQPQVRQAIVVLREENGQHLVAYLTAQHDSAPNVDELRQRLRSVLPEYMVPSAFIVLDALPLTPNGKVDRNALPAPDGHRPALTGHYVAPRDTTERDVAAIWQEVLHVSRVGVYDNFFDLGGDSLLIAQTYHRLSQTFAPLSIATLFQHPTVESLAGYLGRREAPGQSVQRARARAARQRDILQRSWRARVDTACGGARS